MPHDKLCWGEKIRKGIGKVATDLFRKLLNRDTHRMSVGHVRLVNCVVELGYD